MNFVMRNSRHSRGCLIGGPRSDPRYVSFRKTHKSADLRPS